MIDWMRVGELRSEIGIDGFAEVVELFLDEVEGVVVRLKTRPDPAKFESDLHFLKGGAWNLGFAEFGALCQDGERKAADGHRDDIDIARVVDVYFTSRDIFLAGLTDRGLADVSAA
ncbi:MAG: Hpt domain-containing protein [Rhodobacteraceae bacterium]|nr:Hpt domain-containing protein [Paracoccaceae bacterium]